MVLLDEVQAVVDDGQGDEPQEVHLEHAHVLNVMAVVLRGAYVLAGFLVLGQGDGEVVREVSAADDGGTRVHAHLPHATFQRGCISEHIPVDFRAAFQLFFHLRDILEAVLEIDFDLVPLIVAQAVRHHLGEAVALVYANVGDTGDVLDGALGGHGAKSNYARHVRGAVLLLHVLVRLGEVLEVHVDIRHGDSIRVQETLEQELVLNRV